MRLNTPAVQMFLNMRLPVALPKRPMFPDPRTKPQNWRLRVVPPGAHPSRRPVAGNEKLDPAA